MTHMSLYPLLSSLFALAAVLGLLWFTARLLRMGGMAPRAGGRLQLLGSLALDPRRRLVLVRADRREYLLLTGGANDLLLAELGERAP